MQGVTGSSPVAGTKSVLYEQAKSPPSVGFFVSKTPLIIPIQSSNTYKPLNVLPAGVVALMRLSVSLQSGVSVVTIISVSPIHLQRLYEVNRKLSRPRTTRQV